MVADTPAAPLPPSVVEFLTGDDRAEPCASDAAYARQQIERIVVNECEDALHAAAQGRWSKANTYSYDGARKAVEQLLLAHGWRIRNAPGAHGAVVEVVERWLGNEPPPGPRVAKQLGASRVARHDDEYPSPHGRTRTDRELRAMAEDNARLINAVREQFGLPVLRDLVPTDRTLEGRPER